MGVMEPMVIVSVVPTMAIQFGWSPALWMLGGLMVSLGGVLFNLVSWRRTDSATPLAQAVASV
jgi:hypothetical protein